MAMECWLSRSKRPGTLAEGDSPSTSESSRPGLGIGLIDYLGVPKVRRRVEPGALLRERADHLEPQRLRELAQLRQRRLELGVAHAGELHRRHDGAGWFLAGFFQGESIATDPAPGSNSPPRIFMNVDLLLPLA